MIVMVCRHTESGCLPWLSGKVLARIVPRIRKENTEKENWSRIARNSPEAA